MKFLKILTIISVILISGVSFAEEEEAPSKLVAPIKEIKTPELNFDDLSKETKVGCLAEYVKDNDSTLESFLDRIKLHKSKKVILYPSVEELAYVNGELCHVGHYPQSIIYTILEGPHYGLQTTTDIFGMVLYVNYDYEIEYTPFGVILYHYYSDSKVITGSNQAISFYK